MPNLAPKTILALCLLGLAGLPAQKEEDYFFDLRNMRLDESTIFNGELHNTRDDRRRYLFQYGFRPTLVVTPTGKLRSGYLDDKAAKAQLVRSFKRIDALARRWSKRGVEVLCLHPTYRDRGARRKKGEAIPVFDPASSVRPKNMAMVHDKRDWRYVFVKEEGAALSFGALNRGDAGFAWLLLLEPAKVADLGRDVSAPALVKALSELPEDPLAAKHATRKVLDAIAEYRLDEAATRIAALVDKQEPEVIKTLSDRLAAAELLYAEIVLLPFKERDLLPDYVERAEQAVELHWRNKGRGAALRKQLVDMREQARFKEIDAQRQGYLQIRERQEKREQQAWAEYEKVNKGKGYDEALANQYLKRHLARSLEEWRAWLEANRSSPYRSHAGLEYLELKETLQH